MSDTREITVLGISGTVTQPFTEGHVVTAAEAKVLNQTRAENIANNVRSKIKDLADEDGTFTKAAAKEAADLIATVDASYVFTLASASGRKTLDPVEKEAKSLATSVLTDNIRAKGMTVKAYREQEGGDERYAELLDQLMQHPDILAKAKELVEAKSGLGSIKLD